MGSLLKNANDKLAKLDVNELFVYDESFSTCLRWRHLRKGRGGKLVPRLNGGQAGGKNKEGFLTLACQGSNYSVPKVVWMLHNGPIPDDCSIKHKDGDRLNAKIANLELKKDTSDFPEKYCEELKQYVKYDESSASCLQWIDKSARGSRVKEGDLAGSLDAMDGYWKLHAFKSHYKVHRIVWYLHHGKIPEGMHIDHINGKRGDNRIKNLRLVKPEFNGRNRSRNKNNKTGHAMVSYTEFFNHRGTLIRRYSVVVNHNRRIKAAAFSCVKYGDERALEMAIAWRDKMIEKLNEQGAGYTDRHGT